MGNSSFWHKWITAAKVCVKLLSEWRSIFLIFPISKNSTQSQHWPRFKNTWTTWGKWLSTLGIPYCCSVRFVSGNCSFVWCPRFCSRLHLYIRFVPEIDRSKTLVTVNCMDQKPFWEGDIHSALLQIPHILWKHKVHYRAHNSRPYSNQIKIKVFWHVTTCRLENIYRCLECTVFIFRIK